MKNHLLKTLVHERSSRHFTLVISMVFGVLGMSMAQNLCTNLPAGSARGDFDININTGCSPVALSITDTKGNTNLSYDFYYDLSANPNLGSVNTNTYTTNASIGTQTFTILQKGSKAGQDTYACKTVTVKPSVKLDYSYTICNNNVTITIPNTLINQEFNSILIDWDNTTIDNISLNNLPYTKTSNLILPKNIILKANSILNTCNNTTTIQAIALNPATFPLGYDLPFHPNISKLELFEKGKVELTLKGGYENIGYNLFMYPKSTFQPILTPIKSGVLPGKIELIVPDTTKSYCFYMSKNNSCGLEQSNEICTIPINQSLTIDPTKNKFNWEAYPDKQFNLLNQNQFGRFLNRDLKIIKYTNAINSTIIPIFNPNINSFEESIFNCAEKRCYQITMKTSGQLYYYNFEGESISNKICIDRKEFKPPKITDLFVTVNDNSQKPEIFFTDNSGWSISKNYFYLYKTVNNQITKIDSSTLTNSFMDNTFIDNTKPSCYKIGYKDVCNSFSILSEEVCSINLNYQNNKLVWSTSSPFTNTSLLNYDVINFEESTNAEIRLNTLLPNQNQIDINLKNQNYTFEAKYKIKAQNSSFKISNSNTITIPIEVSVFLPTVFTPNKDTHNNEIAAQGNLSRVQQFDFKVYNRWGILVYQTNDKNFKWDGSVQGTNLSSGGYFFKIDMELDTGEKISKAGELLLIR